MFDMKKLSILAILTFLMPFIALTTDNTFQNLNSIYDALPDIVNCKPGTLKQSEIDRVLERVNYIRSLHKLKPVTYEYSGQQMSMEGCLNMIASGSIGHVDDPSSKCYTPGAGQARLKSNLHFQMSSNPTTVISEDIIIGWLIDDHNADQAQEYKVGHRRAIINPFLTRFSFGRADAKPQGSQWYYTGSNFLYQDFTNGSIADTDLEYIAYPYEYYPPSYFNKSFYLSFNVIASKTNLWQNQNVDYSGTIVTMTNESGAIVSVHSVKNDNEGWGSFPNNISWKADGLANEVRYNIEIKNVKVNGQSKNYSYWFKLTSKNQTSPPLTPTPILPENLAKNVNVKNAFTWSLTDNTNKFLLQVSKNQQFTDIVVDKNNLPTNSYIPNELVHSTQYWWRVASENDAGRSPWSEVFTFTTSMPLPAKVTLFDPVDKTKLRTTTPTLSWKKADRAETYSIQISRDAQFEGFSIRYTKSAIEELFHEIPKGRLENNTTYYWRIRASNETGFGEYSDIWSFEIGSSMDAPGLLYPANGATNVNTNPTITWSPVDGAESYRIQISTKEGFDGSLVVNQGSLTESKYVFNNSESGVLYRWRVRGESSSGNGDWSSAYSFTTDPGSSIKETDNSGINISPNPVSDHLIIRMACQEYKNIKISIFDLNGTRMAVFDGNAHEGLEEIKINMSDLSSGVYLIVITDGIKVTTKQFTKIN